MEAGGCQHRLSSLELVEAQVLLSSEGGVPEGRYSHPSSLEREEEQEGRLLSLVAVGEDRLCWVVEEVALQSLEED